MTLWALWELMFDILQSMQFKNVPADGVENEHDATVDHIPFVPGQLVNGVRDEVVIWNADARKERLLPETTTSKVSSRSVDNAEGQDAFDRA